MWRDKEIKKDDVNPTVRGDPPIRITYQELYKMIFRYLWAEYQKDHRCKNKDNRSSVKLNGPQN